MFEGDNLHVFCRKWVPMILILSTFRFQLCGQKHLYRGL